MLGNRHCLSQIALILLRSAYCGGSIFSFTTDQEELDGVR